MPSLSAPQLAKLRAGAQTSNWYCVPIVPTIVFAAQVNSGSITVGAVDIPYDNVTTGAFGNVLKGMTVLVGSAPGLSDYGTLRERKNADASKLYVAWNSDIAWADNLYLTVYQEFLVWSIPHRIVAPVIYKDYDIAYTDQTDKWPPVALMGDNVCKLWQGNPTAVYFDGSASYAVAQGATITSYAWAFGDGGTSTSATPGNHNYTSAGTYYATLTVTDSNGKTHLTRRIVSLPDPATIYTVNFEGTALEGAIDDGWKATVRVFDPNADESHFPSRAPCFIISSDTYNGVAGSVGFPTGREDVVFFGYIVEGSVAVQPEYNEVTFSLESCAGVASRADMYPLFVRDTDNPASMPDAWGWGKNLNPFRAVAFTLQYNTTLMDVADVSIYNDTTLVRSFDMPADNMWNMLTQLVKATRLLRTGVTRTGRIVIGRDPNLTPISGRGGYTTVCTLQLGDYEEQVTIPLRPFSQTSFICISGLTWDGNTAHESNPAFGMSPGRPPKSYGAEREIQFLRVTDQVEINTLAGLLLGTDNMPYGDIVIPLRGNWVKCFDPALQEYVQTPAGGFVTKRGTLLDSVKLIVRKVSVKFDWEHGTMFPTLTCDYYSYPDIGVNGDCFPPDAPPPPQPSIPPIIPTPPPSTQPAPVITSASDHCHDNGGVSFSPNVDVTWTWGGVGSPTYHLEQSIFPTSGFVEIWSGSSTTIEVGALTSGRTYYWRVRAYVGGAFTRYSNVASHVTPFCATVLSMVADGCATVTLNWRQVDGVTAFQVFRSATSGSGYTLVTTQTAGLGTQSYIDTPPSRGTWYYVVRSTTSFGASAYSNEVSGVAGQNTFHSHAVAATPNHIYETFDPIGMGRTPAWSDIIGALPTPITAFQVTGSGTMLVLTGSHLYTRVGGTWVASPNTSDEWAQQGGLWTHAWFNEDGTGPHGFAWWGGRAVETPGSVFPCNDPHVVDTAFNIHWTYVAANAYGPMVGDYVPVWGMKNTSFGDCSAANTFVSNKGQIIPSGGGNDVNLPYPGDANLAPFQCNVRDDDLLGFPTFMWHFTPQYGESAEHFFVEYRAENRLDNVHPHTNMPSAFDTVAMTHVTDDEGRIWAWRPGFVTHLWRCNSNTPTSLNWTEYTFGADGAWSVSKLPGTNICRVIDGSGSYYKSVDNGANWTTHSGPPPGGNNIFALPAEPNLLYSHDNNGQLWVSDDEGLHWCLVLDRPNGNEASLGIWIDETS